MLMDFFIKNFMTLMFIHYFYNLDMKHFKNLNDYGKRLFLLLFTKLLSLSFKL